MTKAIPFGAWTPDVASIDSAAVGLATNVLPQGDGYGPFNSPNPVTQTLPGPCRGGLAARQKNGSWLIFAATETRVYRFNPANLGWIDISSTTRAPYVLPPGQYWSFALYGTTLFAAMTGVPLQAYNFETGTNLVDAPLTSGSAAPPAARHVAVVGEFLVLGGLLDDPNAIAWSDQGDPGWWTPGVRQSDIQSFPEGGDVTAFTGGDFGYVFQERAIRRMTFVGGADAFQFDKIEDGRGAIAPWAVAKTGPRTFFLDREGFFALADGASVPIGTDRVNAWYRDLRDPTNAKLSVAVTDPTGPRVFWAFKSKNSSDLTTLDQGVCYDFVRDRWTKLDLPLRYWLRMETAPISLDTISENVDTGTTPYDFLGGLSLDGAIFSGGVPLIGVFGLDNKLSLLEGPSLEALVETAEARINPNGRAFLTGFGVDTDAPSWLAQSGTRETLSQAEAVRWRNESGPNKQQVYPCRASGRYHRGRVRIPAGQTWTYLKAMRPEVGPEGSL